MISWAVFSDCSAPIKCGVGVIRSKIVSSLCVMNPSPASAAFSECRNLERREGSVGPRSRRASLPGTKRGGALSARTALAELVGEQANRRCFEVVELATTSRPDERHGSERGENHRERQHDEEHGHDFTS